MRRTGLCDGTWLLFLESRDKHPPGFSVSLSCATQQLGDVGPVTQLLWEYFTLYKMGTNLPLSLWLRVVVSIQ